MAVERVAVLGAGITGCMVSIALAQRGVEVDLIDIVPNWRAVGHGITIQGNALRAFEAVGIVDDVIKQAYPFNTLNILRADGALIATVPAARSGGDHLPGTIGSLRASLLKILSDKAQAEGVHIRLGLSATAFDDHDDQVTVSFTDGSDQTYDLVIGADGIRSKTRAMIGIPDQPQPSGMSIWRIAGPRPPQMTTAEIYYGGPHYKAGYSPIAENSCYAYMLDEPIQLSDFEGQPHEILYERSEGYGGTWGELRETIGPDSQVNFTPIEWLLVDAPWHRGRVVIIGDAAHACPPLIAQGAAMCAEDAVVLAEMITTEQPLDEALAAFVERRMPRVRRVVDNSMQLVQWEIHPETPGADPGRLMGETLQSLVPAP